MALTQMQIIQSLGEAMSWLEREISWGANPKELRHLMGRIGELYVAMYTNGNLAEHVHEKGYDVVTKDNERISVKTTSRTSASGFISFNPNTLQYVDRVIILRFNEDEMELEILLDESIEESKKLMVPRGDGKVAIAMSRVFKPEKKVRKDSELVTIKSATYENYNIRELESGAIEVYESGQKHAIVKPTLRKIAGLMGVSIINSKGNPYNTRQLGTFIIQELNQQKS